MQTTNISWCDYSWNPITGCLHAGQQNITKNKHNDKTMTDIGKGHPLEENPNWSGGRVQTSHGYILVKRPDHPDSDSRGYVYEHRLVAAEKIDRAIRENEHVHHKNGKKTDNRPENLEVLTIAEHRARHRDSDRDLRDPDEPNPTIECACGCEKTLKKYDRSNRPREYLPGHNQRDSPTPLQDAVLEALDDGPASPEDIKSKIDRDVTSSTVSGALQRLKGRGDVKKPRRGVWALPHQTVSGKSRQERIESDELIECACGCGETLSRYDEYGREREFISGHNDTNRPSPVQDAVLRVLADADGPLKRSELVDRIEATDSDKAVGQALRTLHNRGEVQKPKHGYWDCNHGGEA
jgi:hypothetical protein